MAKTVTQAFADFKANLDITDWQAGLVSTRRQNVVSALGKELWLHSEGAKVIGSWDRHTLTRYLKEGDVDVMVALDHSRHSDWHTGEGSVKPWIGLRGSWMRRSRRQKRGGIGTALLCGFLSSGLRWSQRLSMTRVPKTHAHRFRHTFATWAIENDTRELDVQYLLGHSTPAMVRRYSATYNSEKAARAHARWSPGDMLNGRAAGDPTSA